MTELPMTDEELRHFKAEGYIIKRGLLSAALCTRARDWVWAHSPDLAESTGLGGRPMRRDDPGSWLGPFTPGPEVHSENSDDPDGFIKGDRWIVQCPFGSTELFCDVLPRRVMPLAEQLLGAGALVQPVPGTPWNRERWGWERGGGLHGCGMYATLPQVPGERLPATQNVIHIDGQACNLGCVGLIDDVPPDGGGFSIYPRSHRRLHHAVDHAYANGVTADYYRIKEDIVANEPPLIFEGNAGDVILYHHRMAHAAHTQVTVHSTDSHACTLAWCPRLGVHNCLLHSWNKLTTGLLNGACGNLPELLWSHTHDLVLRLCHL